jgi:hypothetical protein
VIRATIARGFVTIVALLFAFLRAIATALTQGAFDVAIVVWRSRLQLAQRRATVAALAIAVVAFFGAVNRTVSTLEANGTWRRTLEPWIRC